ncbi:MAG TPA: hypothetical protein VKE74_20060 [Gemmataceae bacterium]|nr:hypothetical protein [Gemmataceae bacterium]
MDPYNPIPVDPDAIGPDGQPQTPSPDALSEGPAANERVKTDDLIDAANVGLLGAGGANVLTGVGGTIDDATAPVAEVSGDLIADISDAAGGVMEGAGSALDGAALEGCGSCSVAVLVALTLAAGTAMAVFR